MLRALLEKRVHAFISKDNDRLIKESLTKGVRYLRAAKAKAAAKAAGQDPTPAAPGARRPGVTVVDLWVNALSGKAAAAFMGQAGNEGIPELLGGDSRASSTLQHLLVTMDRAASTSASSRPGSPPRRRARCSTRWPTHPDRLRVALVVRPARPARAAGPPPARPGRAPGRRAGAGHALVHQYPLNDKLYYPVYTACAELGLPVSINVGIPGPRVRSACQHPRLLEDVLIDFKGLTVIGAHMGHPYEALLMQYMLKWPDLYLSNSAYLAKYMDPALVSFMDSSRGMGRGPLRVGPSLPPDGAGGGRRPGPASLRAAADAFLGGTATRLLHLA